MSRRTITSFRGSSELLDCLVSLFTLEVLNPSKEIYIVSPWISNTSIIDNSTGRFTSLFPYAQSKDIRLADILLAFESNGSDVRIITNLDSKENIEFVRSLKGKIQCKILNDNHEKGMITDNFYISGSMNFTYRGININSESVVVNSVLEDISKALVSMRSKWEEAQEL